MVASDDDLKAASEDDLMVNSEDDLMVASDDVSFDDNTLSRVGDLDDKSKKNILLSL